MERIFAHVSFYRVYYGLIKASLAVFFKTLFVAVVVLGTRVL